MQEEHQHTGYNLNEDSISNYKKNSALSNYANSNGNNNGNVNSKEDEIAQLE